LESLEIWALVDGVALDGDQAVLVAALGVLVDETARVDAGHLGVVQGLDLLELAGVGVAAELRQAFDMVSTETIRINLGMLTRWGYRSW
jgi:hypothetical protein